MKHVLLGLIMLAAFSVQADDQRDYCVGYIMGADDTTRERMSVLKRKGGREAQLAAADLMMFAAGVVAASSSNVSKRKIDKIGEGFSKGVGDTGKTRRLALKGCKALVSG